MAVTSSGSDISIPAATMNSRNINASYTTRVGMGICKYLAELYVVACWLHYTCKQYIIRLRVVSALHIYSLRLCKTSWLRCTCTASYTSRIFPGGPTGYIYIYIDIYVCVYIYIYIYRERDRERERER